MLSACTVSTHLCLSASVLLARCRLSLQLPEFHYHLHLCSTSVNCCYSLSNIIPPPAIRFGPCLIINFVHLNRAARFFWCICKFFFKFNLVAIIKTNPAAMKALLLTYNKLCVGVTARGGNVFELSCQSFKMMILQVSAKQNILAFHSELHHLL